MIRNISTQGKEERNEVYTYHIDCSPEHLQKVDEAGNKTVDELQRIFDAGGISFETIR